MTKSPEYIPATADTLARLHTAEAIGTAVQIMRNKGAKDADRMRAVEYITDRGHGRSVQATIAVPARAALASRLAAMDDSALFAIAASARAARSGEVPLSLPAPFGLGADDITDVEYAEANPERAPQGDADPAEPDEFETTPNLPGNPWD